MKIFNLNKEPFCKGDLVVPKPTFKHLDDDYFKGLIGVVIDIKRVRLSYEKYFIRVRVAGTMEWFYASALQKAEL